MAPPAACGGQADLPHLGPLVWPTLGVVANAGELCVEATGLLGGEICPQATGTKACCFVFDLYHMQKKMAPIRDRRMLTSG